MILSMGEELLMIKRPSSFVTVDMLVPGTDIFACLSMVLVSLSLTIPVTTDISVWAIDANAHNMSPIAVINSFFIILVLFSFVWINPFSAKLMKKSIQTTKKRYFLT
jgi:hypothetical protein